MALGFIFISVCSMEGATTTFHCAFLYCIMTIKKLWTLNGANWLLHPFSVARQNVNCSWYFITLVRPQELTHIWLVFGSLVLVKFLCPVFYPVSWHHDVTSACWLSTHEQSFSGLMSCWWCCLLNSKDLNILLFLQTSAENLINGLEEYIAESFVRTTSFTHKHHADYNSPSNVLCCVLGM